MKKNAVKNFMLSDVTFAITGMIIALVGLYFVYFSKNETLLELAPIMVIFGLGNFSIGSKQALEKKKNLRNLSSKLNADKASETSHNTSDIVNALDEKIIAKTIDSDTKKKLISPKQRMKEGFLTLTLSLIIIVLLSLFSIYKEVSFNVIFAYDIFCVIVILRGVYVLKTLRKYNKRYFKDKYIQPTSNADDALLKEQIDNYLSGLVQFEDVEPTSNKVLAAFVILMAIGLIFINLKAII